MSDLAAERKLYVSLTGTERAEWKRGLAILGLGTFVAGILVGVGVAGAISTSVPPKSGSRGLNESED